MFEPACGDQEELGLIHSYSLYLSCLTPTLLYLVRGGGNRQVRCRTITGNLFFPPNNNNNERGKNRDSNTIHQWTIENRRFNKCSNNNSPRVKREKLKTRYIGKSIPHFIEFQCFAVDKWQSCTAYMMMERFRLPDLKREV